MLKYFHFLGSHIFSLICFYTSLTVLLCTLLVTPCISYKHVAMYAHVLNGDYKYLSLCTGGFCILANL